MYIGRTIDGNETPVFWDCHTPIFNNKPSAALVTGAPGSGKTFFALYATSLNALLGKQVVVIDPKGDFLPLKTMEDELGTVNIIDIEAMEQKPGILDPFNIAPPEKSLSLAMGILDIFKGGLTSREEAIITPIIEDLINTGSPTLHKLVEQMRKSDKDEVRTLGTTFSTYEKMPHGRLCFAKTRRKSPMKLGKGLTIFCLLNLDLPTEGSTEDELTKEQRFALGIMYLLTDFLKSIMATGVETPKLLVIDEAHVIISSSQGSKIIKNIALLGRSKSLAMMLITQNNSHLDKLDIKNTITSRFAFRTNRDEAEAIIREMELPQNENREEIIMNLSQGECLMKDFEENCAVVGIDLWRKDWAKKFETNPQELMRRRREEATKE